jgi:hypothetical protein
MAIGVEANLLYSVYCHIRRAFTCELASCCAHISAVVTRVGPGARWRSDDAEPRQGSVSEAPEELGDATRNGRRQYEGTSLLAVLGFHGEPDLFQGPRIRTPGAGQPVGQTWSGRCLPFSAAASWFCPSGEPARTLSPGGIEMYMRRGGVAAVCRLKDPLQLTALTVCSAPSSAPRPRSARRAPWPPRRYTRSPCA